MGCGDDDCKTITLTAPLTVQQRGSNRDSAIETDEFCQRLQERQELNDSFRQLTDSDVDRMIEILNSVIATRIDIHTASLTRRREQLIKYLQATLSQACIGQNTRPDWT